MTSPAAPGCSGTPLAKKLGIRAGDTVGVCHAPDDYAAWLAPLPEGVVLTAKRTVPVTLMHTFVTRRVDLERELADWRARLPPAVPVWVSWPKKASRRPTDVTEDTVREVALPMGWVDVKVCAVSDVWSGLKLVVRKTLR